MSSPIKWHGGKHYLANEIRQLMPPHTHYVEPYAGGLSVLLSGDGEGVSEVVNDLNWELTNFWQVLQSEKALAEFARKCEATPFSQPMWETADHCIGMKKVGSMCRNCAEGPCVLCAWIFFIHCRQSLAGRMKSFAPLSKTRTRRGMNEQVSAWLTAIEGFPEVHARIKRVVILCDDAVAVIKREDSERTFFYLDPPYMGESRASKDSYGQFEMTIKQHAELLEAITHPVFKGKVMISGYITPLYEQKLHDWRRRTFILPNNAAGGDSKRPMQECLWMNYP